MMQACETPPVSPTARRSNTEAAQLHSLMEQLCASQPGSPKHKKGDNAYEAPVSNDDGIISAKPVYGGDYPWVATKFKVQVEAGLQPLKWANQLAQRLLFPEGIVLEFDGSFRRPGESEPLFPAGGVELWWRWDALGRRIVIDFFNDGELMEWRWDELTPSEDLRFPNLVPDWVGVGHVGKLTFQYSLIAEENLQLTSVMLPVLDELYDGCDSTDDEHPISKENLQPNFIRPALYEEHFIVEEKLQLNSYRILDELEMLATEMHAEEFINLEGCFLYV